MNSDDPNLPPPDDVAESSSKPIAGEVFEVADQNSAEVEPNPVSNQRVALPQPNLLIAIFLTAVPMIAQIAGLVMIMVVVFLYLLATARSGEMLKVFNDLQAFMLPVGTLITLVVAVAVSAAFFQRNLARKIAWRGTSVGQMLCVLALTLPLAVLASEVTNGVGDLFQHFEIDLLTTMNETNAELFQEFVAQPGWLVFLGACLLPGLGEEIYCRGLLSHGLLARYGVFGGTLFAAGLFGAMHIEPVQATGAFALGIGLQFVFLTTRSIAAPIVLHTLNNSLAFLSMRVAESYPLPGLTPNSDGSISHVPWMVLVTATLFAGLVMAILYQGRTRWRLPDGADWSPGYVTAEAPHASVGATVFRAPVNLWLVAGAMVALVLLVMSLIASNLSVVGAA